MILLARDQVQISRFLRKSFQCLEKVDFKNEVLIKTSSPLLLTEKVFDSKSEKANEK